MKETKERKQSHTKKKTMSKNKTRKAYKMRKTRKIRGGRDRQYEMDIVKYNVPTGESMVTVATNNDPIIVSGVLDLENFGKIVSKYAGNIENELIITQKGLSNPSYRRKLITVTVPDKGSLNLNARIKKRNMSSSPALVLPSSAPALVLPSSAPALVLPSSAPALVLPSSAPALVLPSSTATKGPLPIAQVPTIVKGLPKEHVLLPIVQAPTIVNKTEQPTLRRSTRAAAKSGQIPDAFAGMADNKSQFSDSDFVPSISISTTPDTPKKKATSKKKK